MEGNRFVKNTSWILFGQIIKIFVSFIINILVVRYLGPTNYGVINYVNSYIAFFTTLIGLGMNGVIIYEFVNYREEENAIIGTAIALRAVIGIISVLSFVVLINLTDGNDTIIKTAAYLQAIQLPFLCLDTINYWYQSILKSKYSVIAQIVAHAVSSAFKLFLMLTDCGVELFNLAISLDAIVLGLSYWLFYRKHSSGIMCFRRHVAYRLLKGCFPFILANMMVVIYGQIDKIMIKQLMSSETQVGLYSAAITICGYIGFIPLALLDSGRPIIAEAKQKGDDFFSHRFKQLASGIIWICILYSIIITLFSDILIKTLYGEQYLDSSACLKIAVWYTAFSYLGSARSMWLICEKKNRFVFIFSFMGAFSNVIMNWTMIPIWGINGAAIATLVTQILANFLFPAFFTDTRTYSSLVYQAFLLRGVNTKELIAPFINKAKYIFKKV